MGLEGKEGGGRRGRGVRRPSELAMVHQVAEELGEFQLLSAKFSSLKHHSEGGQGKETAGKSRSEGKHSTRQDRPSTRQDRPPGRRLKGVKCDLCDFTTSQKTFLQGHLVRAHGLVEEGKFVQKEKEEMAKKKTGRKNKMNELASETDPTVFEIAKLF